MFHSQYRLIDSDTVVSRRAVSDVKQPSRNEVILQSVAE